MKRITMDVSDELYWLMAKSVGDDENSYSNISNPKRRERFITEDIKIALYKEFGLEPPMRAEEKRKEMMRAKRMERLSRELEELKRDRESELHDVDRPENNSY